MLTPGTQLRAQSPGNLAFGTITVNSTTGYVAVPVNWTNNTGYTGSQAGVQLQFYVNVDNHCLDETAIKNSVNSTTFSSSNVTVSGNQVTIYKSNPSLLGAYSPLITLYFRGAPGVTARVGVNGSQTRINTSGFNFVSINLPTTNPIEYALGGGYDIGGHIRKAPEPYPGTPAECEDGSDLGIPNIRVDFEPYPTPDCFVGSAYVTEEFSEDGYYETLDLPSHYVYTITPDKGNGTACDCGITDNSMGDIKFAQDVLLEQADFETLQQLMAADFNGDGVFSTLDVALMSACVHDLGVPSGWKPWVFVSQADYDVANDPPFDIEDIPDLPGYITLGAPLTSNVTDADFYGIKRGDILEQDCTECGPADMLTSRPADRDAWTVRELFFEERALEKGREYLLPLRSAAIQNLRLLDLALYFDPAVVEVLGFEKGTISDDHFVTGITEESGGMQAWQFGWFSMRRGGEQVSENAALLYLRVRARQDVASLNGLFWQAGSARLNSAFQGAEGRYNQLVLGVHGTTNQVFKACLMGPNPTDAATRIAAYLPAAETVRWTLIDMSGRTVQSGQSDMLQGWNDLQIWSASPGLQTLLLQSNFGSATVRFVRQ